MSQTGGDGVLEAAMSAAAGLDDVGAPRACDSPCRARTPEGLLADGHLEFIPQLLDEIDVRQRTPVATIEGRIRPLACRVASPWGSAALKRRTRSLAN